ncbi:MAG: CHAD domain-containing protein [Opitutaceae bacterium]|nr:CHAD domain-containing protein [Opitutaceae bacterium]
MAFRLDPGRALGPEVLRVIRHQLAAAIAGAQDTELAAAERAHRARVACKRTRAAIGLIRNCDPARWKPESKALRRAARAVAAIRESGVLLETLNGLDEQWGDKQEARSIAHLRQRLLARSRGKGATAGVRAPLALFAKRLQRVATRVADLAVEGDDFDLIGPGIEKTYRRARQAFRRASRDSSSKAFHTWRKHTKAHAFHLELLQAAWPDVLGNWRRKLQILGRLLGDEHDLVTLQDWLAREWREKNDRRNVRDLLEFISSRRSELREDALELGQKVFAEKPAALGRRLAAWWATAADTARQTRS